MLLETHISASPVPLGARLETSFLSPLISLSITKGEGEKAVQKPRTKRVFVCELEAYVPQMHEAGRKKLEILILRPSGCSTISPMSWLPRRDY